MGTGQFIFDPDVMLPTLYLVTDSIPFYLG
jgi:hypothetical protein